MASKAQQTITVEFKSKNEDQLIKAIKSLDRASKDLTRTQKKLSETTDKVNHSQSKTRKQTRILGGTFATIRSKLLLFNFAMALGVRQLGRFAVQASKVESMSRAFGTLAGSTEGSRASLEKLKIATNNTMSEFDLFQQANNAMILGVSRNSSEMAEMFDIAQRLGRALGRDTASSVESLVTGIGRQSRLMLDNIGIIVKADEAYESYAKKLGVNVEQLTDAEKKQAFLTATMESARAKVKTLGNETLTSQDIYDRLSSSTADLATATGNVLSPTMTLMAKVFTKLAQATTGYFNSITFAKRPINEFTSSEQAMLILLARRTNAVKAIDNFERRSSREKMNALPIQVKNKERLAEIDEKLLQLNLGNMKAILDIATAQENKNNVDEEGNVKGLYRVELAQQELDILRNKNEFLRDGLNIEEQLDLIEDERILNQLKRNNGDITAQELKKKDLELTGKQIQLEEKLSQAKLTTISSALGAMSGLLEMSRQTFEIGKALAIAQAVIDAYGAGNKVLNSKLPFPINLVAMAGVIATGLTNVAKIRAQKFAEGGIVGGNRHSQGGTIIEAERGEFVMSRNAVQSIGAETLNQMNQTGSAGITLNISAPLVDETVVDTIIPAIQKAQRMNLA